MGVIVAAIPLAPTPEFPSDMLVRVFVAELLLPDFLLILAGFALCRWTPIDRSVWEPVERLVYFVLFPVLLVQSILRSPLELASAGQMIGAGLSLAFTGIALSLLLPHLPLLGARIDRRQHAAAAQIAFRFNSFIALALVDRLAGAAGLAQMAVLIGVCVPLYNAAAVWPMARHDEGGVLRQLLRNPLIIATLAGVLLNLAGARIPAAIEPAVTRVGAASLALGLMSAGAGLRLASLRSDRLLSASVLGIRHLVLPAVGLGLCSVFALSRVQADVLLVFSALPTASTAYVLAARMGFDAPYVAALVTLSTFAAIPSLTWAITVLR